MSKFPELESTIETINKLRDPKNGCPWDLEQTHESLLKYLMEESYEYMDAVKSGNDQEIKDELGDVLLQVILHSKIADDRKAFNIEDVAKNLKEKIIHRHPHVFDPEHKSLSSQEVEENWQKIKSSQKKESFIKKDVLNFPSLFSAYKIGKKSTKCNFDWEDYNQVIYKVEEEWQELKEELTPHRQINRAKVKEELGDMLFSMAQLSRHLGFDPEETLREANQKFLNRFHKMESLVISEGKDLLDMTQNELDNYWVEVKRGE